MESPNNQITDSYSYEDNDDSLATILNEDTPRVCQPSGIKTQLKQHQLAIIYQCDKLERTCETPIIINSDDNPEYKFEIRSKLGIIGDVVGSGKTLSILGLISNFYQSQPKYNFLDLDINHNSITNSMFTIKTVACPSVRVLNVSIIVVPHSIFSQWRTTIQDNIENINYACINNKKTLEEFKKTILIDVKEDESSKDRYNKVLNNIEKNGIIMISSTFVQRLGDHLNTLTEYKTIYIRRLVIDEADTIKISKYTPFFRPLFTWMITSTYQAMLNPEGKILWKNVQTGELSTYYNYSNGFTYRQRINGIHSRGYVYNIMQSFCRTVHFNYRKYMIIKNDNKFVNMAFKLEPAIQHIIECEMPLSLRVLSDAVSKSILNKINAGDIRGALDELECDKVSEKDLINEVTKKLDSELQNKRIEFDMKSKMSFSSEQQKKEQLDKIKEKIVHIENKIDNIKSKLNDNTACNICFDEMENITLAPCCNTKFCLECITHWLTMQHSKKSCPFCRAPLSLKNLIIIDDNAQQKKPKSNTLKSKVDQLREIIEKRKTESDDFKLLIFSDYASALNNFVPVLEELNMSYSTITGTTNTIAKRMRQYKSAGDDKIDCLLLNTEYCASGLNLENTSDIIITHKMTPSKTHQIIGRGQRPGRNGKLNIWKLFYKNEIDSN